MEQLKRSGPAREVLKLGQDAAQPVRRTGLEGVVLSKTC